MGSPFDASPSKILSWFEGVKALTGAFPTTNNTSNLRNPAACRTHVPVSKKTLCSGVSPRPTGRVIARLKASLRHLAIPTICLLCHQSTPADSLCAACRESLPWNVRPCRRCAAGGLPRGIDLCADCQHRSPPFCRTLAPLLYRGPSARWIVQAKRQTGGVAARLLGRLLADAVAAHYEPEQLPDALVVVPVSWQRLLRRGHNQAVLIAEPVCRATGIPLQRRAVARIRHTAIQPGLSTRARLVNVRDAFKARRIWHGESVALIDDVMTTGATASALSEVLLDAGVAEVHVWCAARAAVS